MTLPLPNHLLPLLRQIGQVADQKGMRAYLVGGFVRDLLLGALTLDLDIVVEGNAVELAKHLAAQWKAAITVHPQFLTATVHGADEPTNALGGVRRIDFVTARRERYPHPAVLPEVEPATLWDDLWRRDFSINAMAISLAPDTFGNLIDPTNGYEDLQRRRIRILHDRSFVDDPTRIFRAIRYEQRFGFRMERKTFRLLCQARDDSLLSRLTRDRIKHELWRILQEREPEKALGRLHQLRICQVVAPELRPTPYRLQWLKRLRFWLEWHHQRFLQDSVEREWALLLPLLPSSEAIASFCQRFQLGERRRQDGEMFLRALTRKVTQRPSQWVEWLNPLSLEAVLAIAARRTLPGQDVLWDTYLTNWRFARPDISGEDLKAYGVQGHAIAIGLKAALAAKLDEQADANRQLQRALEAVQKHQKAFAKSPAHSVGQ